jgi:hypothetical protein
MIEYFKCLRLRICYKGHAEWRDEEGDENENDDSETENDETYSDSGEENIAEDNAETTSNEITPIETSPENIPEHLSNIYAENSSSSTSDVEIY